MIEAVLPNDAAERFSTLMLFGMPIVNAGADDVVDHLAGIQRPAAHPYRIAFINAHCINVAANDAAYRRALSQAELRLPDGSGLAIAARMIGGRLIENLNGTDLFPLLCEQAARTGRSLYLLGARPGIADAAGAAMVARYPGLRIAGCRDGYFGTADADAVIRDINASGADMLFVGLGVPAQDLWLHEHAERLDVRVTLGVGGLFDYYSGRIPRAPERLRRLGFEWLWRLAQEPSRLARRYLLGNPAFMLRALLYALQRGDAHHG